jgi:hypothetical protein
MMPGDPTASHFVSPLRIPRHTAFTAVRFGEVALRPEITALRRELDGQLSAVLTRLPHPLWREAVSTIDRYAGEAGHFYRLFYVPVWSFLHWVPAAAQRPLDPAVLQNAKTAHGLSLFLHLWDDHLCDGQLPVDLLRLQIRTEAWQAYVTAARCVAAEVAPISSLVEDHTGRYLTAAHAAEPVGSLDTFCLRFLDQIAIWTLTPRLLGAAAGGEAAAAALERVIASFALAWRLVDDIQDIDRDLLDGVRSAIWHCLDEPGRRAWDACRAASLAAGDLDETTWRALSASASDPACVPRLLALADRHIVDAAQAAASQGWRGIVRELAQSRLHMHLRGRTPRTSRRQPARSQ